MEADGETRFYSNFSLRELFPKLQRLTRKQLDAATARSDAVVLEDDGVWQIMKSGAVFEGTVDVMGEGDERYRNLSLSLALHFGKTGLTVMVIDANRTTNKG